VGRSEEDVLAGVLRVTVGGRERELPVLTIALARAWKAELVSVLAGQIGGMRFDSIEDTGAIAAAVGDRMLDLVVAYDTGATLGGREYLEAHATDAEMYLAFRSVLEVSFPFVRDLPSAVAVLQALAASAPSLEPRSTSPSFGSGTSELPDDSSASSPKSS
jgi:hypothetical protein